MIHVAPAATRAGAATFDQGDVVADFLAAGRTPPERAVRDGFGHASGLLAWDFDLAPGKALVLDVATAMDGSPAAVAAAAAARPADFVRPTPPPPPRGAPAAATS